MTTQCGVRNDNGLDFKISDNENGEAEYAEFPWMVAILENVRKASKRVVLCGASLLTPKVVLTAAHCVDR